MIPVSVVHVARLDSGRRHIRLSAQSEQRISNQRCARVRLSRNQHFLPQAGNGDPEGSRTDHEGGRAQRESASLATC